MANGDEDVNMALADNTLETGAAPASRAKRNASGLGFDVLLVVAVGALMIFGLMMVYSATFDWSYQDFGDPAAIFIKQLGWAGLGLAVMFGMSRINYHRFRQFAVPIIAVTALALLAVLILGSLRFGAVRAFLNGSVQPSELAKFATIVYLAVWLASKGDKIHNLTYGLVPFGVIVGTLATLILLQPDLSAAITVVMIALLLFFIAGADVIQLASVLALGAGTMWAILQLPISLAETGRQRLADYMAGLQDLTQASWHIQQAAVAFVNGGLFGRGLGESHQKFGPLPTPHTDSIFAIIGEELGLIGCVLVILLFAVIVWRGFRIARTAVDPLGSLLAFGITAWIALEATINVAVMVGAMPFAGNPLPFISYGGSNLVMTLTAIGVLLNISRRTEAEPLQRKVRAKVTDFSWGNRGRSVSRPGRRG